MEIDDEGAAEIANRSRGTPRIANRLLRRVRDFADVKVMVWLIKKRLMQRYKCWMSII